MNALWLPLSVALNISIIGHLCQPINAAQIGTLFFIWLSVSLHSVLAVPSDTVNTSGITIMPYLQYYDGVCCQHMGTSKGVHKLC